MFMELISKRLYQSSGKEKGSRCLVFTPSAKGCSPQRRQRKEQKSVRHVHCSCFANLSLLLFSRSRHHRRRTGASRVTIPDCGTYFGCSSLLVSKVFRAVAVRGVNTVHTVSAVHAVLASPVVSFCSHSCLFISSPTSLNINNFSFISWGQR